MAVRKLVVVGDAPIAEVAYEYFTHDSDYDVVAFAVERDYLQRDVLFDQPVVPFETVQDLYPPAEHDLFVAVGYPQLNRLRARLFAAGKAKGYRLATYVSSRAFVWPNVTLGENCFIFEDNTLQPFVTVGDNVTMWSGNHIGHHSTVRNHVFISSHVVLSGYVDVGEYCFFGVNSTVADNLTVAPDCLIGAAAIVLRSTEPGRIYPSKMTTPHDRTTYERFGVEPA